MAKKQLAKKTVQKKRSLKKSPLKKPLKASAPKVQKSAAPRKAKALTNGVQLDASGSFLKVGAKAPAFKLPNEKDQLVSLAGLKGKKLVLYFYPKDLTPGCTQESCDFRDSFARLSQQNVIVLGISRDNLASHQKFQTKYQLPFSLLSDADGKMCEAYGVWKEKNLYGRKYMGIERTTFLIDENGKIVKIYPKVSVKGHVSQVLEDLK